MFRNLTTDDMPMLAVEMENDPYHKPEVTEAAGQFASPFLFYNPQTRSLVWHDDEGDVLYINVALEARMMIQFKQGVSKERIRAAFREGFPVMEDLLKKQGVKAIVYNSISKSLNWFFRGFGFRPMENEHRRLLE